MWEQLIPINKADHKSLQIQIRESMVKAILDNMLPTDKPLPSSRALAKELGVARNTIVLALQTLVDEGYLLSLERRGTFVNKSVLKNRLKAVPKLEGDDSSENRPPKWCQNKLVKYPAKQRSLARDYDWSQFRYPFIYGQVDYEYLPLNDWRESVKQSLSALEMRNWSSDKVDQDDALLIKQIQTRVLPRRGIWAREDEILITLGTQNALYLVTSLLVNADTVVGIENPGYPDARNVFALKTSQIQPLAVDEQGLVIDDSLNICHIMYTTPSHQCPTGAIMSMERREQLLEKATNESFVVIEDDYDAEINFASKPLPALKSLDKNGNVIYFGSMSKSFAPGLRLGYMVAPAEFVQEVRALRRLMMRHVPANNQRAAALFISLGHYDSLIHRLQAIYERRWELMKSALDQYFPKDRCYITSGSTSFWVSLPQGKDTTLIAEKLRAYEVIIEPGEPFFLNTETCKVGNVDANAEVDMTDNGLQKHFFRLGFAAIPDHRIEPGIRMIAEVLYGKINL